MMILRVLHLDLIEMVPIISDHLSTSTIYRNFKNDTAIKLVQFCIIIVRLKVPDNMPCP